MRCVECKHWQGDDFDRLKPEDRHGVCDRIRDCIDVEESGYNGGYGYSGMPSVHLEVQGDFGCVLFVAKE